MARLSSIGPGLVLGFVFALSCKDDGGVSQEDAPEAFAQKACEIYYGCACDGGPGNAFSSEDDCRLEVAARVQSGIDEGNDAGLTYDGECFADYVHVVDDLGCAATVDLLYDVDLLAAFDRVDRCKWFSGTRAAGQSCTALQDGNGDDCQPELACEQGRCVAPPRSTGVGQACAAQEECQAGLVCIDIDGGADRTCEDLPLAGETCKGTADLCAIDTYCDQGSKTCRTLPTPGSACAPAPNTVQLRCSLYAECDAMDLCVEAPSGGQACTGFCQPGFACQAGVCAEQAPLSCLLAVLG